MDVKIPTASEAALSGTSAPSGVFPATTALPERLSSAAISNRGVSALADHFSTTSTNESSQIGKEKEKKGVEPKRLDKLRANSRSRINKETRYMRKLRFGEMYPEVYITPVTMATANNFAPSADLQAEECGLLATLGKDDDHVEERDFLPENVMATAWQLHDEYLANRGEGPTTGGKVSTSFYGWSEVLPKYHSRYNSV